jgi:hypothetical protein
VRILRKTGTAKGGECTSLSARRRAGKLPRLTRGARTLVRSAAAKQFSLCDVLSTRIFVGLLQAVVWQQS